MIDNLQPATGKVVGSVIGVWPEHKKFLLKSFADPSPDLERTREVVATLLLRIAEEQGRPLESWAEDYRFLCEEIVFPEELYFRRNDRYRLSTFAEAAATVYNNAEFMARYMNGLLVSDVLWENHARAMGHFRDAYLGRLPAGGEHLEIGPGHGMLLHLAIDAGRFDRLNAWDVSDTSVVHTRHTLSVIGQGDRVEVRQQDVFAPDGLIDNHGRFSTIVLSEVLEHLEKPQEALRTVYDLLLPGQGTAWINVPANSPMPDHLFRLRSMQELCDMLEFAGLEVMDSAAFPMTGVSLESAIRNELTVTYIAVARRRQ